ncbi:hypothetical protein Fa020709_082 [Synechococcus phage S-RIM2]|jgi:phenylalanyl-tRNA synthetase beta subunit|uniref:Uncharacterized protein n=4 Tax=Nerrivikvirus srim2 TaxID=2734125 RepID=A0A1D7RFN7_9CAUD|nr:hypothetical protein SWTG_00054 [Synechococcus phage S-RIM2 R1_1999]AGH06764.1 hypothetical protein SWRG_00070 [Synechococcus phage S-RIM2 R21_2007]AGH06975.1 hypothetical protein SWUG_00065 [Synechococcus phage S-RIM2 R9_2006]AON97595.1 hypothetical protein Fa020709_082 [Synechococcus phage S-RIM2]AGH07185.1 hypothetical protein SWTG_00054 [Synechococcus phage S-RIM2 R1_1999]AON98023.1 hypothetical protein Fa240709_082 [Synechococcus phage S-RIM2]
MSEKIDAWQDNTEAHEAINMCLVQIAERISEIEKYVSELPTPDKIMYKPKGVEEYLNMKQNYDEIYKRLEALESGVQE